jgi:hypothetical protein
MVGLGMQFEPLTNRTPLSERRARINEAWEKAYETASVVMEGQPKTAVVGMDIGGTNIRYTVYEVENGKPAAHEITGGRSRFGTYSIGKETVSITGADKAEYPAKGVTEVANAYGNALQEAMEAAAKKGYIIVGIGVGSPGRFVAKEVSDRVHAGDKHPRSNEFTVAVGNPFSIYAPDKDLPWQKHVVLDLRQMPVLSAAHNLGLSIGEFDGIALNSLLQRVSPATTQVVVSNDATVQMKGLAAANGIVGKKTVYIGPGTGVGVGVMDRDGHALTDGHFQYIRLERRANSGPDAEVFDTIMNEHGGKYARYENPPRAVYPEDLFSGTGVIHMLKQLHFPEHMKTPDTEFAALRDKLYAEKDARIMAAVPYLQSVGRYIGDVLVMLHKGNFRHLDKAWEWPEADKQVAKGFETVIFGGGFGGSPIFREVIFPEVQKRLQQAGLGQVEFVLPEKAEAAAMQAAAMTVSPEALAMTAAELKAHHDRIKAEAVVQSIGRNS